MAEQKAADTQANPWIFLGVDLRHLVQWWLAGWREALSFPAFAWLKPATVVRVYRTAGQPPVAYARGRWVPSFAPAEAKFTAAVLPEDILLRRDLHLPPLSPKEITSALTYEVVGSTPFGADQTVWGWRIKEKQAQKYAVELVMTARSHVDHALREQGLLEQKHTLEIWAEGVEAAPIVLAGFAEPLRMRAERSHLQRMAILLGLIPVLLILWAAIPLVGDKLKLRQAEKALATIQNQTGAVDGQRSQLATQSDVLTAAAAYLVALPSPLSELDLLSQKIPDMAYLERIDINAQRTLIEGQADNAATLMQILSGVPQFTHVRAPSAITRNPATGKERFMLEFSWRPVAPQAAK